MDEIRPLRPQYHYSGLYAQYQSETSDGSCIPSKGEASVATTSISTAAGESHDAVDSSLRQPRYYPPHQFWRKTSWIAITVFIGDLLITVFPCYFIILASKALSLDGVQIATSPIEIAIISKEDNTSQGRIVQQAAQLSPTLFPIIFAAIVGRLMEAYALRRAESGAPLGIIEQLHGSQNLFTAIERALALRSFGVLSIGAVLLWMLSPLGGQSALRVLGRQHSPLPHNNNWIYYLYTSGIDRCCSAFTIDELTQTLWSTMSGIVVGASVSVQRTKGRDIWNNVRIPLLETVPAYLNSQAVNGWYAFDENDYNGSYSALTGIVINGLSENSSLWFVLESFYFNMSCSEPEFFKILHSGNGSIDYGGMLQWANINATSFASRLDGGNNSYLLAMRYDGAPTWEDQNRNQFHIFYVGDYGTSANMSAAYDCKMDKIKVESTVLCVGTTCGVQRIHLASEVPGFTYHMVGRWPFGETGWHTPTNMLNLLATLNPLENLQGFGSPVEMYIKGSDTPFRVSNAGTTHFQNDYHRIPGKQVAQRLSSLINTLYQTSLQKAATAETPSTNMTAILKSQNDVTSWSYMGGLDYEVNFATATLVGDQELYIANKVWITLTLVTSIILLICAVAGLVLKYASRVPDILGYVSSMTREHPDFDYLPGDDKMSVLERARALKYKRVVIAEDDDGILRLRSVDKIRCKNAS